MKRKQHINLIILTGIVLLILINAVIWGGKKENYHLDELYSYQFICQTSYPDIHGDRPDGNYENTWHDRSYFTDYLTISDEEAYDLNGTLSSIREDVHPPLFYLTLEFWISGLFRDHFTKWSGITFNLIIFALALILLYRLAKEMLNSSKWAIAVMCLYGFSVGAVSTVVFIRMYMLLTLFTILLMTALWKLWDLYHQENTGRKEMIPASVLLVASILGGSLTHYYFLICEFFFCLIPGLWLLKERKLKKAVQFAATAISGAVIYLLIWTEVFNDLFRTSRGNEAMDNAALLSKFGSNVKTLAVIIKNELFGGSFIFVFCLAAILILAFMKNRRSRQQIIVSDSGENAGPFMTDITRCMIAFAIAAALTCIVVIQVAPYKNSRYIFNIYPVIVLCTVYIVKKFTETLNVHKRKAAACFAVIAVLMILFGYKTTGVRYLYQGDKEKTAKLEQYSDSPAVFVLKNNLRMKSAELVHYWTIAPQVFPVREQNLNALADDLPDSKRFILYLDEDYTHDERKQIIKEIVQMTHAKDSELLFREDYSKVWLIE